MPDHLLAVPEGYDTDSQAIVGLMAASLDDQSRRLGETVAGLGVEHLEWQERPGRNTIGLLMAHLAGTEIYWLHVGCAGRSPEDILPVMREHLGIDAGGMPLPEDGVHPESLRGRDLKGYLDLLARARSATHELLKNWDDASLDTTFGGAGMTFSHRWVLYHLLEHFAAHFGQILSLLHCMRDHGVQELPEREGGL